MGVENSRPAQASLVLVAAGQSLRMGGSPRKPFIRLQGVSVLERACTALSESDRVAEIVLVLHADDAAQVEREFARSKRFEKVTRCVAGGATRTRSVAAGVRACRAEAKLIAIHDAARPLVTAVQVSACIDAAALHGAALLGVPVRDTLKEADAAQRSVRTLARQRFWLAQTPQCFEAARLRALYAAAERDALEATDDAALWEAQHGPVALVEGDARNFKLTTPGDLALAEALLRAESNARSPISMQHSLRIGTGFDVHRLVAGRPCILGGVNLEHAAGPAGHSDGDAVLHALADALLGAAGLDDLGTLFPDSDPAYAGADSAALLRRVLELVQAAGFVPHNVDIVIATEGPRIAPHRAALRANIARLLAIDSACVNVKGKSLEGLGALAGGAGVAVHAVCLLSARPAPDCV